MYARKIDVDYSIKGTFFDTWFYLSTNKVSEAFRDAKITYSMIGGTSIQMYVLDTILKEMNSKNIENISYNHDVHKELRPTDDMDFVIYNDENYSKKIKHVKEYLIEHNLEEYDKELYEFGINRDEGTHRFYVTLNSTNTDSNKIKITAISDNPLTYKILEKRKEINFKKGDINISITNGPIENTMLGKYIRLNLERDVVDFHTIMKHMGNNVDYDLFAQNIIDIIKLSKKGKLNKHFEKKKLRLDAFIPMMYENDSIITTQEFYETFLYDIYSKLKETGQVEEFYKFRDSVKHPTFA